MSKYYCPVCVDYFEDIKEHHYQNHDKKLKDWVFGKGEIEAYRYELFQMNDAYVFTEINK